MKDHHEDTARHAGPRAPGRTGAGTTGRDDSHTHAERHAGRHVVPSADLHTELHVEHADLCQARFHDEAALSRVILGCREYLHAAHGVAEHESEELASEALAAVWVSVKEGESADAIVRQMRIALDHAHRREVRHRRRYQTGVGIDVLRESARVFGGDSVSALIEFDDAMDVVHAVRLLVPVALRSLRRDHHDVIVHYYRFQSCGLAPHDPEPPVFATPAEGLHALRAARQAFTEALLREIGERERSGHGEAAVLRDARHFLSGRVAVAEGACGEPVRHAARCGGAACGGHHGHHGHGGHSAHEPRHADDSQQAHGSEEAHDLHAGQSGGRHVPHPRHGYDGGGTA
ncbi:MAG: hypothetical protein HMLKMBBP_02125 [Planctomycetes bacterium]|nr:hypothetical protein [Planctomycetota bacterium]